MDSYLRMDRVIEAAKKSGAQVGGGACEEGKERRWCALSTLVKIAGLSKVVFLR